MFIACLGACANNKGADQTEQRPSQIRAIVFHCPCRILVFLATCKVSNFLLVSVAEHADLILLWRHTFLETWLIFCKMQGIDISKLV